MRGFLFAVLCLGLALPALAQTSGRRLSGALVLPAGVTLAPDAGVTVRAEGAFGTTLGEAAMDARAPLVFDMEVPRDLAGRLVAEITVAGVPRWIMSGVSFAAGAGEVDFGAVPLREVAPLDYATTLVCGDRRVRFGALGDAAAARIDGREIALARAVSASGARYVGVEDAGVEVFTKGHWAIVTLDGEQLPQCVAAPPPGEARYAASGTAPGWSVVLDGEVARLDTGDGIRHQTFERPRVWPVPGAYRFDMPGAGARLTVRPGLCRDGALPRPDRAGLRVGGHTLPGCGGDPAGLLTGPEWRIEDVGGAGIVDGSTVTIVFEEGGRVAGSTGCNRYFGRYDLTAAGLGFGPLGATMMACPEALMGQERRVLDAFAQVRRFDIDDTGALVLFGGSVDAPLLLARQP